MDNSRVKRQKNKNYVTFCNAIMKEKSITLKAKGLYSLVMSLPDDWDFSVAGICTICTEQSGAIYSAINELIVAGYCDRKMVSEKGRFVGAEYNFHEKKKVRQQQEKEQIEKPYEEKPYVENPHTENTDNNTILSNTDVLSNKEEEKNKKRVNNKSFTPKKNSFVKPTIQQIDEYINQKGLHFDAERFFDHYESNGWMVGRNKMKDWKAACRTWEHKRKEYVNNEEEPTEESTQPDLWQRQQEWFKRNVPNIAHLITKEMYGKMRIICIVQMDFQQALLNMNEGFEGDFLEAFREEVKRCAGG